MRPIQYRGVPVVQRHAGFRYGFYYEQYMYGRPICHLIRNLEWQLFYVAPESVGQFTWLLDKNWKEIYEGDIYRIQDHYHWKDTTFSRDTYFAIVYREYWFFASVVKASDTSDAHYSWYGRYKVGDDYSLPHIEGGVAKKLEIIGNIYENPELVGNPLTPTESSPMGEPQSTSPLEPTTAETTENVGRSPTETPTENVQEGRGSGEYLSDCHWAKVKTEWGDEQDSPYGRTQYYLCEQCGKPCSPKNTNQ